MTSSGRIGIVHVLFLRFVRSFGVGHPMRREVVDWWFDHALLVDAPDGNVLVALRAIFGARPRRNQWYLIAGDLVDYGYLELTDQGMVCTQRPMVIEV